MKQTTQKPENFFFFFLLDLRKETEKFSKALTLYVSSLSQPILYRYKVQRQIDAI